LSNIFPVGQQDSPTHSRDILSAPQTVEPSIAEGPARPLSYTRPEALRSIVNEEGPAGARDPLECDQICWQPVKSRWDNTKHLAQIELQKRILIEVERLWIRVAKPDHEPGTDHRRRNRKTGIRRDDHLLPARTVFERIEKKRQRRST
jgi:hypothetical protein